MSIYGELDTANECVKRVAEQASIEWSEGTTRYRSEDIARARKYLKQMNQSITSIKKTLQQFETIVLSNNSVKIVSLLNKSKEPNGIPR